MTQRGVGRPVAVLVSALVVLAGLVLVPSTAAHADFASQCAAPTRTVDAGATSITVAPGEVVLVGSDVTAGIDALPAGGTLCVAPGATLTGQYMNNAAGALVVAAGATLDLPSVVVNAGFSLDLEGAASFDGLGVNGSADVHVYADAELVVAGSFTPAGGGYLNEGAFQVQGDLVLNTAAHVENSGSLTVAGSGIVNGTLDNAGLVTFGGGLTVNGSGALQNVCVLGAEGDFVNDSPVSGNSGVMTIEGVFLNNGGWRQSGVAVLTAAGLTDDGSVGGFGGYRFSGTTTVQGSFVGDSAVDPIRVQTVAPPGQIFDVATGTVTNVVRTTVPSAPELPDCAVPGNATADLEVSKSGPATVLEGGTVTYEVVVANHGPAVAQDVVVSDALPAGFTLDPGSTTGTVVDGALTWQLGTLAVGATVPLTFSGTATAPAGSTLLNVVSGTSTTTDPSPANNDGSAESGRVTTQVTGAPPPVNNPPVADDLVRDTVTGALLLGTVTATDPDVGQELTFTALVRPANGLLYLGPSGGFVYLSESDFAGVDTFTYQVCDNGTPVACDTATVTINVRPRASDDLGETFVDVPVTVPVLANDTAGAPLDAALATPPVNGSVALDVATGEATYTPAPGFEGVDTFVYRICSPSAPTLCDTATVTITVRPANNPPTVEPLALVTTTGTPVTGSLVVGDPDAGDAVTSFRGVPPRSGTAVVAGDGTTTYTPRPGFAGRDSFSVFVCDDGTPQLCTTGTATVDVYPVAAPDTSATQQDTAVDIVVTGNDLGAVTAPSLASPPSRGTVTFAGGTARYVPAAGFVGTDTFTYTICASTAPDLCATTTVTVTVAAAPVPPEPGPTPAPPSGGGALAVTGAGPGPLLLAGAVLLLVGGVLLVVARRRA